MLKEVLQLKGNDSRWKLKSSGMNEWMNKWMVSEMANSWANIKERKGCFFNTEWSRRVFISGVVFQSMLFIYLTLIGAKKRKTNTYWSIL